MRSLFRKLRIPLFIIGTFGVLALVVSYLTGVPVFHEFKERIERVAERQLPVPSVGRRARQALDKKLTKAGLQLGSSVFVRIYKQEAELEIWMKDGKRFRKLHSYPICKFSGFLGPKLAEGDKQAPEGFYAVTAKQLNPGSRHYRAFNIGFPNEYDRAHGRTGSALMVHGGCTSIGCYAMTDLGVGEIYRIVEQALKRGQKSVPVHIFPFRMSALKMSQKPIGKWTQFWETLKVGHDLFEMNATPPKVGVCGKRYVFGDKANRCRAIAGWG